MSSVAEIHEGSCSAAMAGERRRWHGSCKYVSVCKRASVGERAGKRASKRASVGERAGERAGKRAGERAGKRAGKRAGVGQRDRVRVRRRTAER